jgi:hypothetical protein
VANGATQTRRSIVVALIVAALVPTAPISARSSVLIEIPSNATKNGQIRVSGFTFQIGSERLSTGDVRFLIQMTEAGAVFSEAQPSVALGRLTQSRNSTSIDGIRSLTARRDGHSASCSFEISADLLGDRATIFSFTNPATDGQGRSMPAGTIFFARLRDFVKR